jgi:hypothetical protein
MHFHLPRPLHGWRELAGEVGIIVIGVLIALGAEQVVQSIHDRHVAHETRMLVKEELQTDLGDLALRKTAEPCIARRLGELRAIVAEWGRTGSFRTPLWVAQSPSFEGDFSRYEAAIAAGRIALLSNEEQARLGLIVANLRKFEAIQETEAGTWSTLRLLQMGPEVLTPTDRTMIWQALQTASTLDYDARLRIRQLLPEAADYGYRPDLGRFHQLASRIWKSGRYTPSICVGIDTAPAKANIQSGQVTPLPQ